MKHPLCRSLRVAASPLKGATLAAQPSWFCSVFDVSYFYRCVIGAQCRSY